MKKTAFCLMIAIFMVSSNTMAMESEADSAADPCYAALANVVQGFSVLQTIARAEATSHLYLDPLTRLIGKRHPLLPLSVPSALAPRRTPRLTRDTTQAILAGLSTLHERLCDTGKDQLRYHELVITIDQLLTIIGQQVLLLENNLDNPVTVANSARIVCELETQLFTLLRQLPAPERTGISAPAREGIAGLLHAAQHDQLDELATSDPLSLKPLATAALHTGLAVLTKLRQRQASQKSPEALVRTAQSSAEPPSALTITLQRLIELARSGMAYIHAAPTAADAAEMHDERTPLQHTMDWLRAHQDMHLEESLFAEGLQFAALPDRGPTALWIARNLMWSGLLSQAGVSTEHIAFLKEFEVPPSSVAAMSDQLAHRFNLSDEFRASIRAAIPGLCAKFNWLFSKELVDGLEELHAHVDPALATLDTGAHHAAAAQEEDERFITFLRSLGEQELAIRTRPEATPEGTP